MKFDCDMISDLLPLYKDGICSESSKKIVEEHLAECPSCSNMMSKMDDTTIDEEIVKEKNEIIKSQAKFFKRKSALAGFILALVFAIPVLICFIVDIAAGAGLSWFFIVFAAMLIPTSLIVTPLMMPKNKMVTTMGAFTASIILLLAVCAIYSHGSWFFVAASAVLFGLTIVFAPFIACGKPVKDYLKDKKGLAIMGSYTLTFVIMMIIIGIHSGSASFFPVAFAVSGPLIALAWLIFGVIRYAPFNGLTKSGICVTVIALSSYLIPRFSSFISAKTVSGTDVVVTQSLSYAPLIAGVVIGAALLVSGIIFGIVKGGKKNAKA